MTVTVKNMFFWVVMLSSFKSVQLFRTYCLHLQGRRVSQARESRNRLQAKHLLLPLSCLADCLTMKMEPICSLKYLSASELSGITIEKTVFFGGLISFTGLHHHAKLHVYVTSQWKHMLLPFCSINFISTQVLHSYLCRNIRSKN
jgi:hypothetical protein